MLSRSSLALLHNCHTALAGVPIARDAALAGVGLDLRVSPQATLGLSYAGQIANSAQDGSSW